MTKPVRKSATVHKWCWPYGDAQHDPWPGDLALVTYANWYRFDGQHWRCA